MEDFEKEVIEEFNKEIGSDIANLEKCYKLKEKYSKQQAEIEKIVSLECNIHDLKECLNCICF